MNSRFENEAANTHEGGPEAKYLDSVPIVFLLTLSY